MLTASAHRCLQLPGFELHQRNILLFHLGKRNYIEPDIALCKPRAVNANGMNEISILIPCHRVIGSDGNLTDYDGGLWCKMVVGFRKKISVRIKITIKKISSCLGFDVRLTNNILHSMYYDYTIFRQNIF